MDLSGGLRSFWDDIALLEEQIKQAKEKVFQPVAPPSDTSSPTCIVLDDGSTESTLRKDAQPPVLEQDEEMGRSDVVATSKHLSRSRLARSVSTPVCSVSSCTARDQRTVPSLQSFRAHVVRAREPIHTSNQFSQPTTRPENTANPRPLVFCSSMDPCGDDQVSTACPKAPNQVVLSHHIDTRNNRTIHETRPPQVASPTMDGTATKDSVPTDHRRSKREQRPSSLAPKRHFRWCGHGPLWTTLALGSASMGCLLAMGSRRSVAFAHLTQPLYIAPIYEPIETMGLIRMELCYNETATVAVSRLSMEETVNDDSTAPFPMAGCETVRLSPEEVDDSMFNFSRSLLTLGTGLGIALTVILCTSIVWETINLRPIGFSFLLAYFFQSFALLFFDSTVCREYKCRLGPGGIQCIVASLCWLGAGVAVAKMDAFKLHAHRIRRRAARQAKRDGRARARTALPPATPYAPLPEEKPRDDTSVATTGVSEHSSDNELVTVTLHTDNPEQVLFHV